MGAGVQPYSKEKEDMMYICNVLYACSIMCQWIKCVNII